MMMIKRLYIFKAKDFNQQYMTMIVYLIVVYFSIAMAFHSRLPSISMSRFHENHSNQKVPITITRKPPIHTVIQQKLGISSNIMKLMLGSSALFPWKTQASTKTGLDAIKIPEVACITSTMDRIPYSLDVIKKQNDNRVYKAINLPNELRVLLVSDIDSQRAAGACDVHVGSLSDPKEIPGMAHFCEHMSFLGTKKFPQEEGFTSFLSSHGGSSNAYTDSEDTVYYFDVNSDYLNEALDRFSQFFIAPLFTPSATNRELNAIDSEHAKNINNDGFRIYQIEKDSANPLHPLNQFATGNKDTLETIPKSKGIDVREELLSFHRKYYSANQMTLCIVSNQSISELEKLVKKYFSAVPNRNAVDPASLYWGQIPPYLPLQAANMLDIVPIDDSRKISLTWPIWIRSNLERQDLLVKKPDAIISHLIGHEGKGSLRSYLVSKGWANGVQAAVSNDISDMQLFEISISLTPDGLKNRYDVIDAVFGYLDMLKSQKIPEYVYMEVMKLSKISFDYSEKSDASDYASRLVTDMQAYPNPSQYLIGSRLYQYPDECSVQSYLSQLIPEQTRILTLSKQFDKTANQIESYYGTKYSNYSAIVETVRWKNIKATKFPFHIPEPNVLIPTDFRLVSEMTNDNDDPILSSDIKKISSINSMLGISKISTMSSVLNKAILSKEERLMLLSEPPIEIRSDNRWSVWHKLDRVFKQPKVYAIFSFAVNKSKYSPSFVVQSKLFAAAFLDSINEYLYDASLAGLRFEISFTSRGMDLIFSGFSDKLDLFVSQIMFYLNTYKVNEKTLNRFKELLTRELANWKTQQPYMHGGYYFSLATETLQYSIEEMSKALKMSTSLKEIDRFLKENTNESYGQALLIGNIDQTKSLAIVDIIDKTLGFRPLSSPNLRSCRKVVEIPPSINISKVLNNTSFTEPNLKLGYRLSHVEPNENDDNSACSFSFQLPSRRIEDQILVEILSGVIEQPFYNSLRTQQQLGYIVSSRARARDGIYSLAFTVQSSIVSGAELTIRIEKFVDEASVTFANMDEKTLNDFKQGFISQKLEPDQRLTSHAERLWGEIVIASLRSIDSNEPIKPLFDRELQEVQAIRNVTVEKFQSFVKDFLSPLGKNRRLIVSEITSLSSSSVELSEEMVKQQYELVQDEVAFRESLPLIA